jgi:CRP/FNR family cyclic AMP-dependent transcriptional regulator
MELGSSNESLEGPGPPSEALRRALRGSGRQVRARKGRTLLTVGGHPGEVFLVEEGEAQVLLYAPSGREITVRDLRPGAIFGELSALDGAPRSASVMAVTDLRVHLIPRAAFMAAIETTPGASLWLARRLGAEVRRLTERVFELSALNVQARLHCELLRLARSQGGVDGVTLDPAPTHAELANRIGTHREAVTRELRMLADRNIVRSSRRALEFMDLGRLQDEVQRAVGATGEILRAS